MMAHDRLGFTPRLAVAGGVAANTSIRQALLNIDPNMIAPPLALCTDNAAMIAWAGYEKWLAGDAIENDLIPRPRWPLDKVSPALIGKGKKGAKA